MGSPQKDSLGDRMKANYEDRYRVMLPRRTYAIVRVDGKAFHSYTRGMARPYDLGLMKCMDAAAVDLCEELAGAEFAFIQSDEISVLLTDFRKIETAAYFDGNLQKLCSISASVATRGFNYAADEEILPRALFDARVFIIPDPIEVENYFIWRQKDAERNSLSMLSQAYASPKQLHGVDRAGQHDIIHAAGDNWNDHPADFKRGRAAVYDLGMFAWGVDHETPVFADTREYLRGRIPIQWAEEIKVLTE